MRTLSRAIAVGLLLTCVAMLVFSIGSLLAPGSAAFPDRPNLGDVLLFGSTFLTFPSVALAIVWKRPRNPVGWLFFAMGLAVTMSVFSGEYVGWPLYAGVDLPASAAVAWIGQWTFNAAGTIFLPFALMLFPDGRLPSPRWRPAAAIALALGTTATAAPALQPGPLIDFPTVLNPFGVPALMGDLQEASESVQFAAIVYTTVVVIAALAVRFRRGGVERQQVKWLLWPATVFFLTFVGALANELLKLRPGFEGLWTVMILTLAGLPLCAGIAILRYRLYDVDVVIRRTLVYALVVAVLGAAYAGIVLALTTAFSGLVGAQALPVAVATLIIAAIFGPVRARMRRLVDRRFYRSQYDARRTVEAFANRLRDEVELDAVSGALAEASERAVQPRSVGVWLRS